MAAQLLFRRRSKLHRGKELRQYANELGVSTDALYDGNGIFNEPELQRRVLEAERSLRENALWMLAFVSAIASVFSAIAACIAVMSNG